MRKCRLANSVGVNRHTGGLEMFVPYLSLGGYVNRHTGGLENKSNKPTNQTNVNRHTGGLEITAKQ